MSVAEAPTGERGRAFFFTAGVAALSITLATIGSLLYPPSVAPPPDAPDLAPLEAMIRWDAGWYGATAPDG